MYGPAVYLGRAPERREFPLGEGELLSGVTSVTRFSKLGAYAGIFKNISLASMDNPRPSLNNVYLDTPIMGLTPDTLECVPSRGHLGKPREYPLTRTGGFPHTGSLPPHLQLIKPTHRCIPPLVGRNHAG